MTAPRVLFVLSADYGERVNADLFCRGQGFHVGIVAPRGADPAGLPEAAARTTFDGPDDVVAAARAFSPDLVVLASAYLFSVNQLLSPQEVDGLVRRLRVGPWRVATTDPWMGFWRRHPREDFILRGFRDGAARRRAQIAMRVHQQRLDASLDEICHLYATPYVDPRRPSLSYFAVTPTPVSQGGGGAVFVMSAYDHGVQRRKHGDRFHRRLLRAFERLLDEGLRPVTLVAPGACRRRLAELGLPREVRCRGFMGLAPFRDMLENADRVVYWNLVSSSLLYAFGARRPIVFLDEGHQVELAAGLRDHVVEHVYDGCAPEVTALESLGAVHGACFERLRHRAGMPPGEIVERLCGRCRERA